MRLQEALETTEQGGFWHRLVFDPAMWLRQMRFSPALSAAIFMIGFASGIGATYKIVQHAQRPRGAISVRSLSQPARVFDSGIRSISQEPGSNQISIKYDTVSTQQAQGSLNDQRIQQLLLFAARNNYNSGVRMDSVDLLTQRSERRRRARGTDLCPALRLQSGSAIESPGRWGLM